MDASNPNGMIVFFLITFFSQVHQRKFDYIIEKKLTALLD